MKGNVLVIGNSGVGKSTLINAVLGKDVAKTGWGTTGTTCKLEIYKSENIPFQVIDTIGFEPSFLKKYKAISAVKKWSKESAGKDGTNKDINVIWFCIDGTSRKLFEDSIKSLSSATSMWKSVPVIVVITKSYSVPERSENIEMVQNAFVNQEKYANNLKKIIPVVAETYMLNETSFVAPEGLSELIDATNELMPEGLKAAENDIADFKLSRKRILAQGVVGTAVTVGTVVGAVPIPFADALILSPLEVAEVNAIAKVYGIKNDEDSKRFLNSIVEIGTVSLVARATISGLKMIPGLNIGTSVLNAVIAAFFVAAVGEGSIYAFEQIYLGKKTVQDIDWVTKIIESKFSGDFAKKLQKLLENSGENIDVKSLVKSILDLFFKK